MSKENVFSLSGFVKDDFLVLILDKIPDNEESLALEVESIKSDDIYQIDIATKFFEKTRKGYRYQVSIQKYLPVKNISLKESDLFIKANDWQLSSLFPISEEAFKDSFYRARTRIKNNNSLIFAIKQQLNYRDLKLCQEAVISVVLLYRLLDLEDHKEIDRYSSKLLLIFEDLKKDFWFYKESTIGSLKFRDEPGHQFFSVASCLWVSLLVAGRYDEVVVVIEEAYSNIDKIPDTKMPLLLWNVMMLCLALSLIKKISGQHEASKDAALYGYKIFVKTLSEDSLPSFLIRELRKIHEVGFSLLQLVEINKVNDINNILKNAHRLESDTGIELINESFTKMARWLRKLK